MKKQLFQIKKKLIIGVAVTALTLITSGIGTFAYASPYSYVSLDVNPSITFTLNRFNRVINIDAINDDGQQILEQLSGLENMPIKEAIKKTIDQISKEGYFDAETDNDEADTDKNDADTDKDVDKDLDSDEIIPSGIVITVSNKDTSESKELSNELQDTVQNNVDNNVEIEVTSIGLNRVKEAEKLGISPGKLNLIEKLKASSSNPESIIATDWMNKPVKEIMHAIKVNKKSNKAIQTEDTNISTPVNATVSDTDIEDNNSKKISEDQSEDEDINNKLDKALEVKKNHTVKASEKASKKLIKATEKATEKIRKEEQKLSKKNHVNDLSADKKSSESELKQDKVDYDIENEIEDDDQENESKFKEFKKENNGKYKEEHEDNDSESHEDYDD